MEKISMVNPVTCIFSLTFEEQYFRASYLHHITDTASVKGHAAHFFKSGNIVKRCLQVHK